MALAASVAIPAAVLGAPATGTLAAPPAPPTTRPVPPPAAAVLLADAGTGRVLFAANARAPLPPASLTKMLTAMIADDWLPANINVPVSVRAATVSPDRVGMKPGQRWPFPIVLRALLIASANDAAYALAEHISGSVERFGSVMQLAARELGMSDHPQLRDPAGLDGTQGVGGGNRMSAWDVAIAARDLLANPALAGIVVLTHYRFTGPDGIVYELASHNRGFLESYAGAIGVKTGYTDPAGVCLAEAARRGGRTMLVVVMHGVSPDRTAGILLDRGFATPLAAERRDPLLPAVREPEPVHPAPPAARVVLGHGRPAAAPSSPGIGRTGRPGDDQTPVVVSSAAALGVVGVGTLLIILDARRRVRRRATPR